LPQREAVKRTAVPMLEGAFWTARSKQDKDKAKDQLHSDSSITPATDFTNAATTASMPPPGATLAPILWPSRIDRWCDLGYSGMTELWPLAIFRSLEISRSELPKILSVKSVAGLEIEELIVHANRLQMALAKDRKADLIVFHHMDERLGRILLVPREAVCAHASCRSL